MLAEGNGADHQRRAFARGGMPAVMRHLWAGTRVSTTGPHGGAIVPANGRRRHPGRLSSRDEEHVSQGGALGA
jgi:hypothetical protein